MQNRVVCAGSDGVNKIYKYHIMIYGAAILIFCLFTSGCGSLKLHERKADEANPNDLGSVTELELRGPKGQLSHKF
jgi:hypothetical protein